MQNSSTQLIPSQSHVPQHVAIIMDGNGRWAKKRFLPRTAGHIRGVKAVRQAVEFCAEQGVKFLTLFAFSSENWRRPEEEVKVLMKLFCKMLEKETKRLADNGIRLRIVGDLSPFDDRLRSLINDAQTLTADKTTMTLSIAANYGGRWDILQASERLLNQRLSQADNKPITEQEFSSYLSMNWAPEPDLFIRTGGERRISNFLIWQLAYTELYFTEKFWPDMNADEFAKAFEWYKQRERRFGQISEQLG